MPPYFIQKPVSKYAYEKEDIEFKCEVYGNPMPILEWFKNGDVIIPNEYLQIIHGRNLKILGLVSSDSGIYQCFATNSAGSIQSSAQLVVLPPSKYNKNLLYSYACKYEFAFEKGQNLCFICITDYVYC